MEQLRFQWDDANGPVGRTLLSELRAIESAEVFSLLIGLDVEINL